MFALQSERQAYTEVLQHEVKKVVRMVRAFPPHALEARHPDCGMSARELAGGFVRHVRRIEELASGERPESPYAEARTRGGLLLEFELASASAQETLHRVPPFRWGEVVEAPQDLAPWRQGRRGELLWLALREMVRHSRHFARHLGEVRDGGDDAARRIAPPSETLDLTA